MTRQAELIALIREIRIAFGRLRDSSDILHEDASVTTAMRAVLELLEEGGPQTVPHMARARNVSRQHIQQLVDALVAAGLVEPVANPAHRRSVLLALSQKGRAAFAAMRRREALALKTMLAMLDGVDLAATRAGLADLNAALARLDAGAIRKETAALLPAA